MPSLIPIFARNPEWLRRVVKNLKVIFMKRILLLIGVLWAVLPAGAQVRPKENGGTEAAMYVSLLEKADRKIDLIELVDGELSDFPLTLNLVDPFKGQRFTDGFAAAEDEFMFVVGNGGAEELYFNVLKVTSDGATAVCLPGELKMAALTVMTLTDYVFKFGEPRGVDRFILVAGKKPFDAYKVADMLNRAVRVSSRKSIAPEKVGLAVVSVAVR